MRIFLSLFVMSLLVNNAAISQKYEREYQIKSTDVPDKALQFFQNSRWLNHMDWYKEENQNGISYEAKGKIMGRHWSIEFSDKGDIEDVEVQINPEEVIQSVYRTLRKNIDTLYPGFKIEKIQLHWTGTSSELYKIFENQKVSQSPDVHYEVVIHHNSKDGWKQYEVTLDYQGHIRSKLEIIKRPTDNMDF